MLSPLPVNLWKTLPFASDSPALTVLDTEIDIINRCLRGNQEAYEALYTSYKGYVYTMCYRYGIKEYEIKDAMQVIFTEVFQGLDKYDRKRASFKTWLSRIAINQLLNILRKKNIKFSAILDDDQVVVGDFNTQQTTNYDMKFINKVLANMPASYSVVFNLFVIEGFTHQEIADKLGISVGQSRISLHRGREWAIARLGHYFTDYTVQHRS